MDLARKLERRREAVKALDELKAAGLIDYTLTPRELDGAEPHLHVTATAAALVAPLPAGLSAAAITHWETLIRLHRLRDEQ